MQNGDRARQLREKVGESPETDQHTVMNSRGSETILSPHSKQADAGADQTAKTAVARDNYEFKILKSNQEPNQLRLCTVK
jgi:hypothetical protein